MREATNAVEVEHDVKITMPDGESCSPTSRTP